MTAHLATGPTPAPCTADHLALRTREVGTCHEWTATLMKQQYPIISLRVPGPDGAPVQRQFYVRHLAWWLRHGKPPAVTPKRVITNTCGNTRCINPAHLRLVDKATVLRRTAAQGAWQGHAFAAAVSAGRRRHSKLSDEAAAEIRASTAPLAELASKHGISRAYACMIRRGRFRRDYANPFAGLMA